jgi:hypothetical protein
MEIKSNQGELKELHGDYFFSFRIKWYGFTGAFGIDLHR